MAEFQAHSDCVSNCHFCYHDSVIVTASHDKAIAFWVSSVERRTITDHYNTMTFKIIALSGPSNCRVKVKSSLEGEPGDKATKITAH